MSIQVNTLTQIKALAAKIEGFTPLSTIVPDIIDCDRELNLIKEYLWTFETELTASNYHAFAYGKALAKKK